MTTQIVGSLLRSRQGQPVCPWPFPQGACSVRRSCMTDQIDGAGYEAMRYAGIKAAAYHAGLKERERTGVLDDWSAGRIPVVAATIAFGMGIDRACKPWTAAVRSLCSCKGDGAHLTQRNSPLPLCMCIFHMAWLLIIRQSLPTSW